MKNLLLVGLLVLFATAIIAQTGQDTSGGGAWKKYIYDSSLSAGIFNLRNENKQDEEKPTPFVNFGFAFGVNIDTKGDYAYYVNIDSTILEKVVGKGANGMISAVATINFIYKKKRWYYPGSFILNVPLVETILQEDNSPMGLFNNRAAVGFGLSFRIIETKNHRQSLSIAYIANFTNGKRLDMEYYREYKFMEPYPKKIDVDDYEYELYFKLCHFISVVFCLF